MKKIAALIMMMMSAGTSAQINKCIDSAGRVVGYGSDCPAGTRPEQSSIKSSPSGSSSTAAPAAPKSLAERDAEFRKRQIEKQEADAKAEKKSAEAAQRQRACQDSQTYLKSLQAGQRITHTDPKTGERTYLDDADYPKEIANAERSVSANCK
jgi:hypothetical protein